MAKQYNIPNLPKDYSDASQIEKWMSGIQKLFQSKNDADNKKEIEIEDSRFPVGSWYVQYPSAESNDEDTAFPPSQYPSELFGGTWTEMYSGEGIVFQTNEETDHYTRTNGLMEHHLQNHKHCVVKEASYNTSTLYHDYPIASYSTEAGETEYELDSYAVGGVDANVGASSYPWGCNSGSRTAHRNRVAKFWLRES